MKGGKVLAWLVSVACCYGGLLVVSAQNTEHSLEQGLILYMPLNGDLSDRLGLYHGRERRGGSPPRFSTRSLFDRFSETVILEEKREWVETDRGIDLVAFDEGFTISLWIRPTELIGLVPLSPEEQMTEFDFGEQGVVLIQTSFDAATPTDTVLLSSGGSNDWELRFTDLSHLGTSLDFEMKLPLIGKKAVPQGFDQELADDLNAKQYKFVVAGKVPKMRAERRAHILVRGTGGVFDGVSKETNRKVEIWTDGKLRLSREFPLFDPTDPRARFRHRVSTKFEESVDQIRMGASLLDSQSLFDGRFDDFAIWNRALSEDEIASIWHGGIGAPIGALLADADGDLMEDVWEKRYGLDPTLDDRPGDLDSDGLSNGEEHALGTHPNNPDTDGDGLLDGVELGKTNTSPLFADTDRNHVDDGIENPEFDTRPEPHVECRTIWDSPDFGEPVTDFGAFPQAREEPVISRQGDRTIIRYPIEPNKNYGILYSETMCQSWNLIAEFFPSGEPFLVFEDTDVNRRSSPTGFYRVLEVGE